MRWRSWDGEYLLYHPDSGDTHRLNAVGAAVLRAIDRTGTTTEELIGRIAAELRMDPSTLGESIPELLDRFVDLGLVETCDDPGSRSDGSIAR